ncbi:MAG: corrinoid protein [Candidatus Bathyarchaeota archaeon]|nr:MAG: corrinoid protein [Candidatus Bathyarchaeota archaeon]
MIAEETEIIQSLGEAIWDGDDTKSRELAIKAIQRGINITTVFNNGILEQINRVGDEFGRGNLFLTELFMAANAAKTAMDILMPEMVKQKGETQSLGRIVIGTVAGDIHDLGKNLTAHFLQANGFDVIDLGIDVSRETFIKKVKKLKPDILGLSAMVTTTMPEQKNVIDALTSAGIREKVKVIIGGSSVDPIWTETVGADAYGSDINDSLKKCKELIAS